MGTHKVVHLDPPDDGESLILLAESLASVPHDALPPQVTAAVEEHASAGATLVRHVLRMGYDDLSTEVGRRSKLDPGLEAPGFKL